MKALIFAAAAVAALSLGATAHATTISVTPTLAPNAFGSPSYSAWRANSITALHDGLSIYGAAGPTQYKSQSNVSSANAVVTGFPSWMGMADPGTVFGPAYANEYGNRMLFGLRIDGEGQMIALSDLSFSATSTDPSNALAFGFGAGSYNYGLDYQGVLRGSDGILWTADDIFVTSGLNTTLVDGIVGRGSGNSFAAYCPGCSIEDQQAAIDAVAAYPGNGFTFTGDYGLGGVHGTGTFNISPAIPEPATWALMITGFGLVGTMLRRRRAIVA